MPATSAAASLFVALLANVQAAPIQHYEGMAFDLESGRLLYRESHWVQPGQRLVLYRCTDGRPFARKRVSGGSAAPDFELVDGRDGYREGVRTRDGRREVFVQRSSKSAETHANFAEAGNQIVDAGFDAYVRQQWDALSNAPKQRVSFLVPSRLRSMEFKLTPAGSDAQNRRYTLALDAWYGGIAPNLTVTYASADRRLVRFEGIGNIRDAAGKYPNVRLEFPADRRDTATPAALAGAASAPLTARCGA